MFSAMISSAPCIASSAVFTTLSLFFLSSSDKFSMFIYCSAIFSIGFVSFCSIIISASGSSPFAFATVALVFFFCLYGLYMSSTSAKVCANATALTISSVSFPCSSIDFITSSFLSSKFLKYVSLSPKFLNCSSLSPPVTSFLFLHLLILLYFLLVCILLAILLQFCLLFCPLLNSFLSQLAIIS